MWHGSGCRRKEARRWGGRAQLKGNHGKLGPWHLRVRSLGAPAHSHSGEHGAGSVVGVTLVATMGTQMGGGRLWFWRSQGRQPAVAQGEALVASGPEAKTMADDAERKATARPGQGSHVHVGLGAYLSAKIYGAEAGVMSLPRGIHVNLSQSRHHMLQHLGVLSWRRRSQR